MHGFPRISLPLAWHFRCWAFRTSSCLSNHRTPLRDSAARRPSWSACHGETVENDCVIRILLAERQEIFRDGLTRLLESEPGFKVMGGTGNAPQALQLVRELNPDVLLLDLAL